MIRNVKLNLTGAGHGSTEIDGTDISRGVRGLTITAKAGHLTTIELDLGIHELIVDAETRIIIPDGTRDALLALGWTPPEEA